MGKIDSEGRGKSIALGADFPFHLLFCLLAIPIPVALLPLQLPFIDLLDEVHHPVWLLQIYVFFASIGLTAAGYLAWKQLQEKTFWSIVTVLLPILVAFHFLIVLRHNSTISWDYRCYESAAQAISQGVSPYGGCYLYFPLMAQVFSWIATSTAQLATSLNLQTFAEAEMVWKLVFYLYESSQFIMLIAAFTLCRIFAQKAGADRVSATVLVAALFLFNNAIAGTIRHNQVNLWVLNLILLFMFTLDRYPFISGLLIALGGHIKLYPLSLLLPLGLGRRWRAIAGVIAGFWGVVLLSVGLSGSWKLWTEFVAFSRSFPQGRTLRDNGIHSILFNVFERFGRLFGIEHAGSWPVVNVLYYMLIGVFVAWFIVRFIQRERRYGQQMVSDERSKEASHLASRSKMFSHLLDGIGLGLLISPIVWEHHYVLALPIVIWAIIQRGVQDPWPVGLSVFLIFIVPTFDIFPFSFHRALGLLLVLRVLSPQHVAVYTREKLVTQLWAPVQA